MTGGELAKGPLGPGAPACDAVWGVDIGGYGLTEYGIGRVLIFKRGPGRGAGTGTGMGSAGAGAAMPARTSNRPL